MMKVVSQYHIEFNADLMTRIYVVAGQMIQSGDSFMVNNAVDWAARNGVQFIQRHALDDCIQWSEQFKHDPAQYSIELRA